MAAVAACSPCFHGTSGSRSRAEQQRRTGLATSSRAGRFPQLAGSAPAHVARRRVRVHVRCPTRTRHQATGRCGHDRSPAVSPQEATLRAAAGAGAAGKTSPRDEAACRPPAATRLATPSGRRRPRSAATVRRTFRGSAPAMAAGRTQRPATPTSRARQRLLSEIDRGDPARDNLVAIGVIPVPRSSPNPFRRGGDRVPDPRGADWSASRQIRRDQPDPRSRARFPRMRPGGSLLNGSRGAQREGFD